MIIGDKKAYLAKTGARDSYKNLMHKFKKQAVSEISKGLDITSSEAEDLLKSDTDFQTLMEFKDKEIRMNLITTIYPKFLKALNGKLDQGSLEQAKHALTGLAIIKDKAMGTDKYTAKSAKQILNLQGQNLQINVGFGFQPYTAKQKTKKLK